MTSQAVAGALNVLLRNEDDMFSPHIINSDIYNVDVDGVEVIMRLNNRPVWGGRIVDLLTRPGSQTVTLQVSGILARLNTADWGFPYVDGEAWEHYERLALSSNQAYQSTPHRAHERNTTTVDDFWAPAGQSNYTSIVQLADAFGDWLVEDEFGDARVLALADVESRRRGALTQVAQEVADGQFSSRDYFTSVNVEYLLWDSKTVSMFDWEGDTSIAADTTERFIVSSENAVLEWDDPVITGDSGLTWEWGRQYSKLAELLITSPGSARSLTDIGVSGLAAENIRRRGVLRPESAITDLDRLGQPQPRQRRPWATTMDRAEELADFYASNIARNVIWVVSWYGVPVTLELTDPISFEDANGMGIGGNIVWLRRELSLGLVLKTTALTLPIAINNAQVIILDTGPGLGTGQLGV